MGSFNKTKLRTLNLGLFTYLKINNMNLLNKIGHWILSIELQRINRKTEYENDSRSAGLSEQISERVSGEIPSATEVTIGEKGDISKYSPKHQQFMRETIVKLGGDEQARKLFDAEGLHEWGESYEGFILRTGCNLQTFE